MHGWETWAIREEDKSRITSEGKKFRKRMAKCTRWDYILSEHKINPVLKKIQNYINTSKLIHVRRMDGEFRHYIIYCTGGKLGQLGSEDKSRITSGENKFRKKTAKCTRWE